MGETQAGVISGEGMSVRAMMVLTLPTLAFATAYSLVPTFLPYILKGYTDSDTLIGFAIGGEGIFSFLLPLWVGVTSDRIWTKNWGRRRPFMIFAAPFMAASLMLAPFQPGYVPIAISTFVFFAAYHCYAAPYQSLVADVTPLAFQGRVQGYQSVMRGVGMFVAMVVLGLLFAQWRPLPFMICAVFIMIITYVTVVRVEEPEPVRTETHDQETVWDGVKRVWSATLRDKKMRTFMAAAFLWESSLAGIKPFIVLYFTTNLGASLTMSSLLFAVVGVVYVIAGLGGGYLADRYGRSRIMRIGLWVYLGGTIVGVFINSVEWAFILLPIFGLGGAVVLTLPFAILMRMMPKDQVGGFTAMFSMVRGLAYIIAPLLTGAAIDLTRRLLDGTQYAGREYAAIWIVCGLMIAISLFLFKGRDSDPIESV